MDKKSVLIGVSIVMAVVLSAIIVFLLLARDNEEPEGGLKVAIGATENASAELKAIPATVDFPGFNPDIKVKKGMYLRFENPNEDTFYIKYVFYDSKTNEVLDETDLIPPDKGVEVVMSDVTGANVNKEIRLYATAYYKDSDGKYVPTASAFQQIINVHIT